MRELKQKLEGPEELPRSRDRLSHSWHLFFEPGIHVVQAELKRMTPPASASSAFGWFIGVWPPSTHE